MDTIRNFKGKYDFLSNFSPSEVEWGFKYPTVEHAYQAAKCPREDVEGRRTFLKCKTAGEAKKLGQKVKMRDDWNEIKTKVMEHLLRQKFSNPDLKEALLKTGDAKLEEGNWWGDKFWGTCLNQVTGLWEGENNLGILLMQIREELKSS